MLGPAPRWHGGQQSPELGGSRRGWRVQHGPARQPLSQPCPCRRCSNPSFSWHREAWSFTSVPDRCLSSHHNGEKCCDTLFLPPPTCKASQRRVASPWSEGFLFYFILFLQVLTDSHVLLYQDNYFCLQLRKNVSRYHRILPGYNVRILELAVFLGKNRVILTMLSPAFCTEGCMD